MSYAEDIAFVLSESARMMAADTSAMRNLSLEDAFSMLPHPSGRGSIICGAKAYDRLRSIATVALSRSQHTGRIHPEAVFNELKQIVVSRFLNERQEINTKHADRAVSAAIRKAAKAVQTLTHFRPCHLVQDQSPDHFSIGPVSFWRQNRFFERIEASLQEFIGRDADSELSKKSVSDAREYYGSFGWIAEVKIENCDSRISERLADRIVQNALDCFHLLLGASHSDHMRAGGPNYKRDQRSRIHIDANDCAGISWSLSWRGNRLGDGWWEHLNADGGDGIIELIGVAIDEAHDLIKPSTLSRRFVDAATWYGEATRDELLTSSIVKYVTAIERILTTKSEDKIIDTLANRGAALIFQKSLDDLNFQRKRLRAVYDMRSRIVHGSLSPTESGLGSFAHEASDLAQLILLHSLSYYGERGLRDKDFTDVQLDEAYARLVVWSEDGSSESSATSDL